jgi:hypothetical protein
MRLLSGFCYNLSVVISKLYLAVSTHLNLEILILVTRSNFALHPRLTRIAHYEDTRDSVEDDIFDKNDR